MVWARVDIRDTGERRGHRRSHTAGAGGTKVKERQESMRSERILSLIIMDE